MQQPSRNLHRPSKPDGPEFRVWVTLFALKIPKYIFCVLIQRILIFYGKETEVDDPGVYYKCMQSEDVKIAVTGNHLFSTFRHLYFMNLDPMTVMACLFLLVVMLSIMNALTAIYHPCGRDIIASLSLKECTLLIRIRVNFYALFFIALQTQF